MMNHERLQGLSYDLYGGRLNFSEWCGLRYERSDPDDTRMAIPWSARIADAEGVIGPGILATMADVVAGQVAASLHDWQAQIATVSLGLNVIETMPAGVGLRGLGRCLVSDEGTLLSDVRITTDDAEQKLVATSRLRMIVVARFDAPARADDHYAPMDITASGPFLGPQDMQFAGDRGELVAQIVAQDHFMGNVTRGTVHGGLLASGLFESVAELGRQHGGFGLFDGTVDFLYPGRDLAMEVSARMVRAGGRIGFATAEIVQEVPGSGRQAVARLTATLRR
ncbi:MAG: hypothetical protein KDJ38_11330 [Gammaproteobacteria bacterium]|nr:hypothetical protein [Gammaproteobacteria bacterium]